MHSDMDEVVHVRLEGALAELLTKVSMAPTYFVPHKSVEHCPRELVSCEQRRLQQYVQYESASTLEAGKRDVCHQHLSVTQLRELNGH